MFNLNLGNFDLGLGSFDFSGVGFKMPSLGPTFDFSGGGLLGSAVDSGSSDSTNTSYKPTTDEASMPATDQNSAFGSGYEADQREVKANETVQGQMSSLLDENGSYLKAARTRAAENSNARGLLNSSMAAGAGERAAIETALPIAQQDAATYDTRARTNMSAENRAREVNSSMEHDKVMANLNAELERGTIDQKAYANMRGQYLDSYTSLINEANINISEIQSSADIPAAEKKKMIDQQIAMRNADLAGLERMFKQQPMWQANWSQL